MRIEAWGGRIVMKMSLAPRMEQQQVLAPQMILSMDILLLNSLDLEARIEKEFIENPALSRAFSLRSPEVRPRSKPSLSAGRFLDFGPFPSSASSSFVFLYQRFKAPHIHSHAILGSI